MSERLHIQPDPDHGTAVTYNKRTLGYFHKADRREGDEVDTYVCFSCDYPDGQGGRPYLGAFIGTASSRAKAKEVIATHAFGRR